MFPLSVFALRRLLAPGTVLVATLLLVLVALAADESPLGPHDERAALALRAVARQNAWSLAGLLAPALFFSAARLARPRATAWFDTAPLARWRRAAGLALGCALAGLLATLALALCGEVAAGDGQAAWRHSRRLASPSTVLFGATQTVRWSVPALAPGERLRLWVSLAAGAGQAASVSFRAEAEHATRTAEHLVAGRTALELDPPSGVALTLELERTGDGAFVVSPADGLEVLTPVASERTIAWVLGTRLWAALVAGCGLALGLARVLRAGLAAGLVLALGWGLGVSGAWVAGVPLADVGRVWAELSQGLVPQPMPIGAWGGACLALLAGVALHAGSRGSRA